MISIHVWRGEEGVHLLAQGHAGYDVAGRDIVCAGVSAILFGLKSYLEKQKSRASESVFFIQWDGGLLISTKEFGETDRGAWDVTRASIEEIAKNYPQYVSWNDFMSKEEI